MCVFFLLSFHYKQKLTDLKTNIRERKKKPQKIDCDFCIFVSPTHAIWFLCIQSTPYGVRKIDKQLSTNAMAQRFINNPLLLAQARLKM